MSPVTNTLVRTKKPDHSAVIQYALNNPIATLKQMDDLTLLEIIQMFWNEVSDDTFKMNFHIKLLCKELEKVAYQVAEDKPKLYDLVINIPPGTTKTIICSIMFPVWCWTKWYWMKFITGSYSDTLSLEAAEKCRDIIRCDKFKALYPELGVKKDKDQKSNFRVIKKVQVYPGHVPRTLMGGGRYSTSVGGTLTGFHGHILIWDDPINPKQAASEVELKNANDWLDQTASTRKVDKAVTPSILVMQRLHENDPTGHILEKKKKNVRHICLPAEIVHYRHKLNPPRLAKYYVNGLLDPVRMPWSVLQDMEADLGQYGNAGQMGQDPTPPKGGMFKVDHFRVIDKMPPEVMIVRTVRYWDNAGTDEKELKKGQDAAYTVGTKMSFTTDKKWIISDIVRGRWETHERERIKRETAEADGKNVYIYVEQEPGSGGKDQAKGTIINLAGFHIEANPPVGNKVARADQYSVQVNYGNVLLVRGDWNKTFTDEHRLFPFSKYKDQVDASSGAFTQLTSKKEVRIF